MTSVFLFLKFVVICTQITSSISQSYNLSSTVLVTSTLYESTYFSDTESPKNEIEMHVFTNFWIYTMEALGMLGLILITAMSVHAIHGLYKHNLSDTFSRIVYLIFFIAAWCICLAYTFFRTDLILPMGTTIPCEFGFLFSTHSVLVAKLFLFMIFLLRIDLAFHSSALGYSRWFLSTIMIIYIVTICILDIAFVWDALNLIGLYHSTVTPISVCTTGDSSPYYIYILGCIFLFDVLYSILVGFLFVWKLHKVNKMSQESGGGSSGRSSSLNRTKSEINRMNTLTRLMRKQTTLVLLAVISSLLVFGVGAVVYGFALMMPFDAIVNVFCVWLMFRFSNAIWNKITHVCCYCCSCCSCCGHKDDFLMTMHSIQRKFSVRSSTTTDTRNRKASQQEHHDIPAPIVEEKDEHKDIEIKFDNVITPDDLPSKRIKNITTTTSTTTTTTTVSVKEEVEDRSVDSPKGYDLITEDYPKTGYQPVKQEASQSVGAIELVSTAK